MQDQNKNMIMAIALSLVVLLGWQMFFVAPKEEQARKLRAEQAQLAGDEGTRGSSDLGELPKLGEALVVEIPREQAIAESSRVQFENTNIRGSINLTGGRLDDLVLSNFRETIAEGSPDVSLMSPVGTELPYFASFGWLLSDASIPTPKSDTVWTANRSELSPGNPLDLSWDNGAGLVFHRTFALDENYLFTVNQSIENNGDTTLEVAPYSLINRTGTPEVSQLYILHEGLVGVLEEKLREVDYDDLQDDGNQTFTSTGGWLGITDKYWLVSLMPDKDAAITAGFQFQRRNNQDVYQANLKHESQTLAAGAKIDVMTRLFAGAKEISILDQYTEQYGIYNFDRAVDFGWFYYLTKPIFLLLQWIYGLIGNFGLSILILTVMVKALLFPLANKSYRSMAKMRLLQPKIEEIKKKVGDDCQKLQQEMMALYKQEGANPLAGCLPIIVQIPVFFALYKVFYVTIEMRHAPFFGWIKDMSAPDPTSILNLFGLLPFDAPTAGILTIFSIGIWPILMGISMYGQQLLNPQPTDPTQAQIMRFLPLIFTFILGGFAAGLVIYWTWNNLLSVAQQWIIMRGTKLSDPSDRKKKKA